MRLEKKTMATLLITIFMMSTFAVAYATEGTHLVVDGAPAGNEARIEIAMPVGFTLGDLDTISWSVYAEYGWPPHVDITLGEVPLLESMLTAEIAYNNKLGIEWDEGLTYTYDGWLKTFELTSEDGYDEVDDDTMFWVAKMGAGNDNAPYGTLAQWKAGIVGADPDGELPTTAISAATPVLKLEFEVDSWVYNAAAYVKDIQVNGLSTDLLLEVLPPIVSIMVAPASVDFGSLKYLATKHEEVTVYNIGDVDVTIDVETTGAFFIANLEVTGPAGQIAPSGQGTVELDLTIPWASTPDIYTGKLVFSATPVPP